jgi:hypothetical protein
MSADMHIHVMVDVTEEDLKCFFQSTLGSKYFSWDPDPCPDKIRREAIQDQVHTEALSNFLQNFGKDYEHDELTIKERQEFWRIEKTVCAKYKIEEMDLEETDLYGCVHWEHINNSPNLWVGSVSWLKAAILGDAEKYVPSPVQIISDIIGDDIELTPEVLEKICAAYDVENATQYEIGSKDEMRKFLARYIGKRIFTVSW